MSSALRILLGPFGALGALFLSIVLLVATLTQCADKSAARRQFQTAETGRVKAVKEAADCQADLSRLSLAVDEQNAAIAGYKADSERRLAAAQKAVREAQEAARGASRKAASILAKRPSAPSCETAEAVLRGKEG